ncbi:MAG TPA: hypothetical protein VND45_05140, partial [Thermoanaerobaculia bacterium]|nr:hypothetical protein [Thermoanaerobaculia bacterium]
MKTRLCWLASLLFAATFNLGAQNAPLPQLTAAQWRADVDFFARELPKRHKNAFHAITRERFASEIATLRATAANANSAQMLAGFMRVTALVGDGHTRVNLQPGMLHAFPIAFNDLEGVQRVIRGAGPAADLVGARLVRINDMPLDQVIARVRTVISQDESEVLIQARTPQWFSVAEILQGLGIIPSPDTARYTVAFDDGKERTVELHVLDSSTKPEWRIAAKAQPLYRQRPESSFWYEWLPASSTLYVNFRKYDDLRARAGELWKFVDSHPVKKIAFDLRYNGGGDNNVGRRYLVDEAARRRAKLRTFVITGPQTFSAALKTAIDFRQVAGATLAGEPIGEKPNSYSENDEMTLPNSKLSLSYSTKYFEFLPGNDRLVTPDREIRPTWADWVA